MTTSTLPVDRVPLRTKLAFGAGDIGPAIATAIQSFFLLYFLINIARLSPATASVILLIAKIWDAVNDPFVGVVSDRLHTRWGRRRPWLLWGAVPFGLSFWLLFQVPPFGDVGKFWYYLLVTLLFDTAFTMVNVPYTALTPELSSDYDERTSLNAYRFGFSIAFSLLAAVMHPLIVNGVVGRNGTEAQGYAVSVTLWAIVATVPFLIAFWGTYERQHIATGDEPGFWDGLRITFGNRAFRYVAGIYLLSWLVVQAVSSIIVFYITYWLQRPQLVAPVILAVQGSALVWLMIWTRLSRRLGKKGVYYRGMGFWIAVLLALFAVPANAPTWLVLVLGALAGIGVATAYLVPWAMLPDVIELDELQTGRRREGVFYGFVVLLQKLGLALGLFVIGQVLERSGYITPPPNATAAITQPASALWAIRLLVGPIPALLLITGMLLVYRFPITREQHAATLVELEQRRMIER